MLSNLVPKRASLTGERLIFVSDFFEAAQPPKESVPVLSWIFEWLKGTEIIRLQTVAVLKDLIKT